MNPLDDHPRICIQYEQTSGRVLAIVRRRTFCLGGRAVVGKTDLPDRSYENNSGGILCVQGKFHLVHTFDLVLVCLYSSFLINLPTSYAQD